MLKESSNDMSLETHKTPQEALKNMVEEQDTELGKSAKERYQGPQEASITATRGAIWGAVGGGLGYLLGRLSDAHKLRNPMGFKGYNQTVFAIIGAFTGGVLGMFNGSREVRESKFQLWRMQQRIEHLEDRNVALKQEIKAQLRGEGVLKHFDPKWEKDDAIDTPKAADISNDNTPKNKLDAGSVAAHALHDERPPSRPEELSV